jgi:hypothetical protein
VEQKQDDDVDAILSVPDNILSKDAHVEVATDKLGNVYFGGSSSAGDCDGGNADILQKELSPIQRTHGSTGEDDLPCDQAHGGSSPTDTCNDLQDDLLPCSATVSADPGMLGLTTILDHCDVCAGREDGSIIISSGDIEDVNISATPVDMQDSQGNPTQSLGKDM